MKLDIFNIDEFVEQNNCPEVTNPVFWNFDGTPTSDGLFSYELFGISDDERKNIFGYIDLKDNFLHPIIYQMLIKKSGSLGDIATGRKYGVIADKKIKIVDEDFEGAETGIKFLYDHFYEINWINEVEESEMDSIDKKTRLKFLKSLKKEEFFIRKWLVLPPFYRAESSTNRSMGDAINKLYKELISKVSGLAHGFSFDIFGDETRLRIQNILRDIYLATLAPLSGKNLMLEKGKSDATFAGSGKTSMLRKHLLGKNVDWGASAVITSPPNSDARTIDEKPVPFGYSAFPLATLLSLFQPFYVSECFTFLESALTAFEYSNRDDIKHMDIGQFDSTKIEKLIKTFIKSPSQRFSPIEFEYIDNDGKKAIGTLTIVEYDSREDALNYENGIKRPMTLADLFYTTSMGITKNKHVLVTRFPVANFQNIYPCKIKVLSTNKTKPTWIVLDFEKELTEQYPIVMYDKYPIIPCTGRNIKNDFIDVMICGNAWLDSLGR